MYDCRRGGRREGGANESITAFLPPRKHSLSLYNLGKSVSANKHEITFMCLQYLAHVDTEYEPPTKLALFLPAVQEKISTMEVSSSAPTREGVW